MSLPTPNTRKEQYLNAIATGNAGGLPTPITREEEYLDAIAKSGGGSGDGDMKKSVYDSDLDVAGAGGIKAFVNDAISGKVDKVESKGLSTNDYTNEDKAIVDGVTDALAGKADTEDIPDLVSDNLAKGILGNETVLSTDNVPFVSKLMGEGKYQRKKFVGCSFVWNQMVENGDFSDGTTGWSGTNIASTSAADNTLSFTVSAQNGLMRCTTDFIEGHKYFVSADINISSGVAQLGIMQYVGIPTTKTGVFERIQTIFNATSTGSSSYPRIYDTRESNWDAVQVRNVYKIDLTQLFGSTAIADAIYNLEQATAGAGVAKLKELGFFTENYYAYDAGSVQSVDIKEYSVVDGFNLWDEQWENGEYSGITGQKRTNNHAIRSKNLIPVIPNNDYYLRWTDKYSPRGYFNAAIFFYDVNKKYIGYVGTQKNYTTDTYFSFTVSVDVCYINFYVNDYTDAPITNYYNDICINLSDPVRNGQYEPYHKSTYPLTPTELRGVPKIDANNNIYCDGDEYASDGGHTEKYDIVEIGSLSLSLHMASETRKIFVASVTGIKMVSSAYVKPNLLSSAFMSVSVSTSWVPGQMSFLGVNDPHVVFIADPNYTAETFKAAMSGQYLVYEKATPTTETLTPFDYPQSVGSLEEITDYKVEQEDRDVAIPTGHVTEYMGKGGEFTLPTLPETPSVLAFDGHNFFWKPETT